MTVPIRKSKDNKFYEYYYSGRWHRYFRTEEDLLKHYERYLANKQAQEKRRRERQKVQKLADTQREQNNALQEWKTKLKVVHKELIKWYKRNLRGKAVCCEVCKSIYVYVGSSSTKRHEKSKKHTKELTQTTKKKNIL